MFHGYMISPEGALEGQYEDVVGMLDAVASQSAAGNIFSPFMSDAERQIAVNSAKKFMADQQSKLAQAEKDLAEAREALARAGGTSKPPAATPASNMLNTLLFVGALGAVGYVAMGGTRRRRRR